MSLDSFKLAVDGGCLLCNVLWEELDMRNVEPGVEPFSLAYAIQSNPDASLGTLVFTVALGVVPKQSTNQLITSPSEEAFPYTGQVGSDFFRDFAAKNNEAALLGPEGSRQKSRKGTEVDLQKLMLNLGLSDEELFPIDSNTGSKRTLKLARAWLHECCTNHPSCGTHISNPESQRLPKRVIDLGAGGSGVKMVRLHETTTNQHASYATLTHRWGAVKPMELVTGNEASLKKGIEIKLLPKTFQDAVFVADTLSIRYLWIDSLCIQQDSVDDWREQSALMSTIYRYATVNIAATAAEDSSAGILLERDPLPITPARITLHWQTFSDFDPEQHRAGTRDCLLLPLSLWDSQIEKSQLSTRGWVFQERLLSSRILHFTRTQIFWECPCSNACETVPSGRPFFGVSATTTAFQRFLDHAFIHPRESPERDVGNEIDAYINWGRLIEAYSACQFTMPTDKLIALEGVASQMLQRLNGHDSYMVGHWKRYLAWELLWVAAVRRTPDGAPTLFPATRPKKDKIAPTWSWASLDGAIVPFDLRFTNIGCTQEAPAAFSAHSPNAFVPSPFLVHPWDSETLSLHQTALLITITDTGALEQHNPAEAPTGCSNTASQAPATEGSTASSTNLQSNPSGSQLRHNSDYIEVTGVIFDATIATAVKRHPNGDITNDFESWGVVFGYEGDATVRCPDWSEYSFGTQFAPDDREYFMDSLLPYVEHGDYKSRLVVLPIAWIDGHLEGLLLKQVSEKDAGLRDVAKLPQPCGDSSSSLCFERVGKIEGMNISAFELWR
jgi:Heterokaryon incompatibility protein (HET)